MINFREIIEGLSAEQKISLLCGEKIEGVSLPVLGVANLWESNRGDRGALFPCPESLANSFDAELFAAVAEVLAARGESAGHNLFVLPDGKAPLGTYDAGLSDDPLVNVALLGGCAAALTKRGNGYALKAPKFGRAESKFYADKDNSGVLNDRVLRPYRELLEKEGCRAVVSETGEVNPEYLPKEKKNGSFAVVCSKVADDQAVQELVKGNILMKTDEATLRSAYENYQRIHRSIEDGASTIEELNAALQEGSAVSEETLNEVLNARSVLAAACGGGGERKLPSEEEVEKIALTAAQKSVVLLKNAHGKLPLSRGTKVALVGGVFENGAECNFTDFRDQFTASLEKVRVVGYAQGYRMDQDRCDLTAEAVELAKKSDVVLLALGMGSRRDAILPLMKTLELPANQMALYDALKKTGKPIVAIISDRRVPATAFDESAAATLLIPPQGYMVARALADILEGRYSPSGRLAFEGKDDPDTESAEAQGLLRRGEKKIGPMVGYRGSVSDNVSVKYPFGYGLSYGTVEYGGVSCSGERVKVTVTNKTRHPVAETLQIYVEKPNSPIVRPDRELKAFQHVELRPGERRTLYLPLKWLDLHRAETGEDLKESGNYTIYAARHAGDVTKKTKTYVLGRRITERPANRNDYLQSVSNIRTNQYTMEGSCKPMKTRSALKCLGIFFLLFAAFADLCYLTGAILGFYPMDKTLGLFLFLNALLIAVGIALLLAYRAARRANVVKQRKAEKRATEELFRDVERVEVNSFEELFIDEFDAPEQRKKAEEAYTEEDEGRHVHVPLHTDLPSLVQNMEKFFAERGLNPAPGTMRAAVSSVMTSHLLVFRHPRKKVLDRFTDLLGEFFGSETYRESYQDRAAGEGTLLFRRGAGGSLKESGVLSALRDAKDHSEKPYFVMINDLSLADTATVFTPYLRYFGDPGGKFKVKENGETVVFPQNLWIIVNAMGGDSLENLEPFIANYAAVVDLAATETSLAATLSDHTPVTCSDLDTLLYRSRKSSVVDEDLWKSVDRLESFVNDRATFHIGNKLFLQLERYLAVFTGCGAELNQAMDGALAAKIIPSVIGRLRDVKLQDDKELIHTMQDIFGEENVDRCRHMLANVLMESEDPTERPAPSEIPLTAPVVEEIPLTAPVVEEISTAEPVVEEISAEPSLEVAAEEIPAAEGNEETPAEPTTEPVTADSPAGSFVEEPITPVEEPIVSVEEPVAAPTEAPTAPAAEPVTEEAPVATDSEPVAEEVPPVAENTEEGVDGNVE